MRAVQHRRPLQAGDFASSETGLEAEKYNDVVSLGMPVPGNERGAVGARHPAPALWRAVACQMSISGELENYFSAVDIMTRFSALVKVSQLFQ